MFEQKVTKVNEKNCHIWGSENPNFIIEKLMHPQRVTAWSEFLYSVIIQSFFFVNEQGAAVMVNGERYRAMNNEFLFLNIEEDNMEDIWFQQNEPLATQPT